MIGKKITIEYYDDNVNFECLLPRSGYVVSEISFEDYGNGWYLIKLDEPFDYKQSSDYRNRNAKSEDFKEIHYTHFLIKSRWKGVEIEADEPPSVFVLLVPDSSVFKSDSVLGKDFLHVCWGMVNPIEDKNT